MAQSKAEPAISPTTPIPDETSNAERFGGSARLCLSTIGGQIRLAARWRRCRSRSGGSGPLPLMGIFGSTRRRRPPPAFL